MNCIKKIKKILLHDNIVDLELLEKIINEYLIKFKKSNNIDENSKIDIIKLSEYMEIDKNKMIELLYFNIDSFHQVLYDFDTEIILEVEKQNLYSIFYLALLIEDSQNTIDYSFTIQLIRDIKNILVENHKNKSNIFSSLILTKAIYDLVDAYKGLDEYYNNIKEIHEIETSNTIIIENLINDINNNNELRFNLSLEYIKSNTIDQIYICILIGLLKNKYEDYNYIYNKITEMEIESVKITKKMFEEITNFLDDTKETEIYKILYMEGNFDSDLNTNLKKNLIMEKFLISKPEDLIDENKINFSFILIKYILKSSSFIFQIDFFLEERKNLLKLGKPSPNTDKKLMDKLNYILEVMSIFEYYKNKDIKNDSTLNEVKSSNKSTEIDIPGKPESVKKIPDNFGGTNSKNIKTDSKEKKNSNISYDATNNNLSTLKDSFVNHQTKNKSESYNKKESLNLSHKKEKDQNKDVNLIKTFHYLTLTYRSEKPFTAESFKICTKSNYNIKYKKIGEHRKENKLKKKYTAEFITEIQNLFVSFGTNNELFIYNDSFDKLSTNPVDDWIYNALNYNSSSSKAIFIAPSKKKIYIFSEEKSNSVYKTNENPTEHKLIYLFSMENSYYFSCCEKGIFLYSSLFDKLQNKTTFTIYENLLMKSAIKIDSNFLVFKSNKIVSKGKRQLLLYNYRNKKDIPDFIENYKEEYSFVFSPLGQALIIHKEKDIEDRILLFACKKYIKSKKNGIFILYNMKGVLETQNNISNYKKANSYFYNTDNFEPYCICPLSIIKATKILVESFETKETDYFLVGGFEKKRKKGIIRLYKIINYKKISIDYIQDLKIFDKDFEGFKGPISCITQSKKDGNLLITCWDGKVYLIYNTDINFYLHQDKQIKKSANEFFSRKKDDKKNEIKKTE